uniref:uncharacterized protein LOC120345998 isoform X1 n=1 Tax=Styela clava TaxID=7725 RepID=UPI0019394E38|nr:uncharacterized protein LOC120345998 isoform X1 [Styela clava]XP_039271558.1 uncharacterized protein LOC120345998 isoform X1 [Styela clava]XP_039271559.1 uncharacterized protein LOC120345998 isoform X1 [Styela clava]XP_039271560.1 uncharacterized protein LOC120345998 isoform X2 [Styela clava]
MNTPIVDFASCNNVLENPTNADSSLLIDIGEKLYKSLSEVGCCCLINTGISSTDVDAINGVAETFFTQPIEEKMKCNSDGMEIRYNVMKNKRESHVEAISSEAEYLRFTCSSSNKWPSIEGFVESMSEFQNKCKHVGFLILRSLAIGMKLEIQNSEGEYVDIEFDKNGVLVLCGEEMEIYTGQKLKAVKHRVVTKRSFQGEHTRRSIGYFMASDNHCRLGELRTKNCEQTKKEDKNTLTSGQYYEKRFNGIFNKHKTD